MGITVNELRFLLNARNEGVSFERTITLGRLHWYVKKETFIEEVVHAGQDPSTLPADIFTERFSDRFFQWSGAGTIDSLDRSDYEGATVLHDLNAPLPERLSKRYSVVFDGGTLEHVFDFPRAVRNCMEMVEVGGHFLSCCPCNNEMGHGFYQFSPELWYRVLGPENGFEVERVLIFAQHDGRVVDEFYEVADPGAVKDRVMLINEKPTYLLVQARRIKDVPLFTSTPQQSDYQAVWNHAAQGTVAEGTARSMLVRLYRSIMPARVRDRLYGIRMGLRPSHRTRDLGNLSANHYRPFVPRKKDRPN